jgi:peptidoglycan biosynthesis protein MviN/MurJ (putative lipid II flippase)
MHVGSLTDAYSFALGVALFSSALFAGVLQANVLPILQRMKLLGRIAFLGRTRKITINATAVTGLFYALIAYASVLYIDNQSHWTQQQQQLMLITTIILAVFVLTSAVNGILSAGLNALNSFLSPAASQALKSILPLLAIGFVSRSPEGLIIIAALLSGGELIRTFALTYELRKSASSLPRIPVPADYAADLPLWGVAASTGLASLIVGASPLIDRGVAASLHPGSVTLIDLGEKVLQVPVTIIATSFVLVAGTHWADIRTDDIPSLRAHFHRTIIRGTVFCVLLLLAMIIALGVTRVCAGNMLAGAPTGELLSIVALLLAGLPAAFLIAAGSRLLTATRSSYLLPAFGLCAFTTNFIFDIIGAHAFGVEGIALSSTIYRYVNGILFLLVIRRLMRTDFKRIGLSNLIGRGRVNADTN